MLPNVTIKWIIKQSSVLWAFKLKVQNEAFPWTQLSENNKICLLFLFYFITNLHIYHDSASLSLNRKNICDTILSIEIFSCHYSSHVMATDPRNDLENYQNFVSHSIIGVVGDVRREMSGHHYAEVICNTTQIWETIMSTYRDKYSVKRFVKGSRFVYERTRLTEEAFSIVQ